HPPSPCLTPSPTPRPPGALHSFPTRRSSDLDEGLENVALLDIVEAFQADAAVVAVRDLLDVVLEAAQGRDFVLRDDDAVAHDAEDRKSTRLNSSHVSISYAVFCLKKKRNALQ